MSCDEVTSEQPEALAAMLRAVVDDIEAGDVDASETSTAYLRGAAAALECLTGGVSIS